ncbi:MULTISPECIES: SDR family oxidoreductase [Rhodococcus]|uniref:SDR family oxidoreductase n=1 Tax=Rhodococcus cerastii TaxID=908616 RepID=A0ABU4CUS6_9NOCA|nr:MULTISPECIES: SDR family oxidoreductase [Rhodococcus]MDV6301203.1 SDR family oxidoreductase [Rhodococcus cerastii]MDV7987657.1 SDR family oxidoreductase [Rhodococcus sp. IEGM 1374]
MANFIVTGGTGFLGKNVLPRLLERDALAAIHVLVRPSSVAQLERLAQHLDGGDRIHPLVGDLTEPELGLRDVPSDIDHILHLGAVYDLTAGDEQTPTNVAGTASVIRLAEKTGARLHHISSIAVAGDHRGTFSENDFDLGQAFPTAYHRTKFESEKLVRESAADWRVYRPAAIIGHSETGAIDKVDGPYYFFPFFAELAKLPSAIPITVPKMGSTNLVPVDYVADAIVELVHRDTSSGSVFHLVNTSPQSMAEVYSAFSSAAGSRAKIVAVPGALVAPVVSPKYRAVRKQRDAALRDLGVPPVMLDHLTLPTVFESAATQKALQGSSIAPPPLRTYADRVWTYWRENFDPKRNRRNDPRGSLFGRHIIITGGSSGIGRASAEAAARKGAVVILLARGQDQLDDVVERIRESGGTAYGYPCDVTDSESVEHTVKTVLSEHGHVDMLVNNAGRSIRRSLYRSTDRLHDYERTMAVNYFGAIRLVLALLPHMRERQFGHVVNISSAAVLGHPPRFSAYVASKAALDGFTDVAAAETLSDGITYTTIHMPLVDTPMITPTGDKNVGPVFSPEKAAAMVIRALSDKPKRIDTPLGTLGQFGAIFAPKGKDRTMHQHYRTFAESAAAKGEAQVPLEDGMVPYRVRPYDPKAPSARIGKVIRRAGRLVPGTSW